MKKLLSILAAVGFTACGASTVIACGTSKSKNEIEFTGTEINSSLSIITIKGNNLKKINNDALWDIHSASGFPDAPENEKISVIGDSTDEKIEIKLSVPLEYAQNTMMYDISCKQDGQIYKTTLTISNNSKSIVFYSADINNTADPASSNPGQIITIVGDNLDSISKDDFSSFDIKSEDKDAVPAGEKLESLPEPWSRVLSNTKGLIYVWATMPILKPGKYEISYRDAKVNLVIPAKTPKLHEVKTNDANNEITVSGQDLSDINVSYLSIRYQVGNKPNGITLSIDTSKSNDERLVLKLNKSLEVGNYYVEWSMPGATPVQSQIFEVSSNNSKWVVPDSAKLTSGSIVPLNPDKYTYIEIYTRDIPDNNDCTDLVSVNGEAVSKAQVQSGILKVWTKAPVSEGTKLEIILTLPNSRQLKISIDN